MRLSIIVPILNEAARLPALHAELQPFAANAEIMLVDGGSGDGSVEIARALGFTVLQSAPGRAQQMNHGARASRAEALLFLHADTTLPANAAEILLAALQHQAWGRFDVQITGKAWMLRVVAAMMNLRSRLSGIATGDQAIFCTRVAFEQIGGFPPQALMEDVELSKRLKRLSSPSCLRARVRTSGRRWEQHGVWRTIFLMWQLRWRYWRGESAERLAKVYR